MFWWFTENGLSPYHALCQLVLAGDGKIETQTEIGGRTWVIKIYYSESGIAARPEDPIDGRLWELNLHADGPDEAGADYNISPRFDGMEKASDGEEANIPWCGGDGVDVHVQGSNLGLEEYQYLLAQSVQALADAVGSDFSRSYFRNIRDDSSIVTCELYVRLMREYSRKLTRSDGAFYRLMHLMNTRDNTTWAYSGNNEDGVAKRHAFEVGPSASHEMIPGNRLGKRLKCYHPKHIREEESSDDALSSPKFGVAFHKSLNDHDSVRWGDRDDLLRELEETVHNVLEWSGIPIQPDETVFVEDDHFGISESERDIAIISDPTPELEAEQELLVARTLNDLMPSSQSVLERLATDGGQPVQQVADETGYSISQIYRALAQLGDDVIENDNGLIQLQSEKLRQEIASVVDRLEEHVVNAGNRVAKLARLETRSAADSAFSKWMDKYGARFVRDDGDGDDGGVLRFDMVLSEMKSLDAPYVDDILREGREAWTSAGRDVSEFAQLRYEAPDVLHGPNSRRVGSKITW
ncbi:hypothetical protein JCM18549_27640 [Halolamina salina]